MTDKLALEGGEPSVTKNLMESDWDRFRPTTDEEISAVTDVLRSGHLSISSPLGMPQADALEEEFAEWVGVKHCVVVNTGTAALHCAVAGAGVQAGDQVIVPAHTFQASAMAVLHHNAIPVFVEMDPVTHLIDPAKIEASITSHTTAIMVVHLYGQCCDMDAINAIADRHGLKVIEDCAQSFGTVQNGRKAGALGHAAGFAMTTTKQLTVGEGGLVTTDEYDAYEHARMLRLVGEPGDMKSTERSYMAERVGWNYKLGELSSALARVRLRHLDEFLDGCVANGRRLSDRVESIAGVNPPADSGERGHTYYLYSVSVDPAALNMDVEAGKLRAAAMKALAAENVDMFRWMKVPVPAQPIFQNKVGYGNGSPWNCPGGDVSYDLEQFPNTFAGLDNSFIVRRIVPPNGAELMDRYADAFDKVFGQIDRVLELYNESETYVSLEQRRAGAAPAVA